MSKKVLISLIILLLMLVSSCSSPIKKFSLPPSPIPPSATATGNTPPLLAQAPTKTQSPLLSSTTIPQPTATATATPFPSPTPAVLKTWRNEQNGYGVQYPADWLPETPSVPGRVRFGGTNGFFEVVGIFVGTAGDVDRVSLWKLYQTPGGCYGAIPANSPTQNPSGPCPTQPIHQTPPSSNLNDYCFEHLQKCVIIETNGLNPRYFQLHGIEAQQKYLIFPFELPFPTPVSPTRLPGSLSPTPEKSTPNFLTGFTIDEIPLKSAQSSKENPNFISMGFTEKLPDRIALFGKAEEAYLAKTNAALTLFGYQIKAVCTNCSPGSKGTVYQFIHGSKVLKEDLVGFGNISVSPDKTDYSLLLWGGFSQSWQTWLARNGSLDLYDQLKHLNTAPIYVGSHLITLSGTWDYTIESDGIPIYRCSTFYFQASPKVDNFFTFDGHWALETLGTFIVDGEIWNTSQFPAQEIFETHLFDGKLFFFFRRENQINIYFNGKILPISYTAIHHYGCCGYAAFNPIFGLNGIAFFAIKDGEWNYVTINLGVSAAP